MKLSGNAADNVSGSKISRRKFIKMGLITAAAAALPENVFANAGKILVSERELTFYNLYTHENLKTVYWRDGQYIPEAMSEIDHIFRDLRTGKVRNINKQLMDLLYRIHTKLESSEPFQIISGYRTPKSNAMLRQKNKGVAKNSLHMYGKAVDLRLPGYSLRTVRRAAMSFKAGGVGYYPTSKFIHVDVGQVRYWWG